MYRRVADDVALQRVADDVIPSYFTPEQRTVASQLHRAAQDAGAPRGVIFQQSESIDGEGFVEFDFALDLWTDDQQDAYSVRARFLYEGIDGVLNEVNLKLQLAGETIKELGSFGPDELETIGDVLQEQLTAEKPNV